MADLTPPDQADRQDAYRAKVAAEGHAARPALGTFAEPGVWLSPEIRSLGWTGAEIARRAKEVGARWVALDAAANETGDANTAAFRTVYEACANADITAGLWADNPSALSVANRLIQTKAPFYIVDREVPSMTQPGFLDSLRAACPTVELAVTAGPFDAFPNPLEVGEEPWKAETQPWVDLPMLVMVYVGENPGSTPEGQAVQAAQRRFTKRACVVESNRDHDWNLDTIDPAQVKTYFGRAVSLYMLGSALARDLDKFARMAKETA